jgi:nucleotide-binding universal stress UspA family protein
MNHTEVVVGINGSPASSLALRWAAEEARLRAVPLRIVHTWEVPTGEAMVAGAAFREATEHEALERAMTWVETSLGTQDAPGTVEIVEGPAAAVLVARSRAAALLVVGTQSQSGLRRLVSGSVSHFCVSRASCPVVAVPSPAVVHPFPPPRSEPSSVPGPLL